MLVSFDSLKNIIILQSLIKTTTIIDTKNKNSDYEI